MFSRDTFSCALLLHLPLYVGVATIPDVEEEFNLPIIRDVEEELVLSIIDVEEEVANHPAFFVVVVLCVDHR